MAKWKMKNGQEISIEKMDDKHLYNTIKMLERNCTGSILNMSYPQGEMAQMAFDDGIDDILENGYMMPGIYYKMIKLAKKRKIIDEDYYEL